MCALTGWLVRLTLYIVSQMLIFTLYINAQIGCKQKSCSGVGSVSFTISVLQACEQDRHILVAGFCQLQYLIVSELKAEFLNISKILKEK